MRTTARATSIHCEHQTEDCPIFDLVLNELPATYTQVMDGIPEKLEEILRSEAPKNSRGESLFKRVQGKLYTPEPQNTRSFVVRVMPSKESNVEDHLHFTIYMVDLCFQAFHSKGVWYKLKGFKGRFPPRHQIMFQFVEKITLDTSSDNIGGYDIKIGPLTFMIVYNGLMKADEYVHRKLVHLLRGLPLALPAVAIAEALRDVLLQAWIKSRLPFDSVQLVVPDRYTEFRSMG